MFGGRAPSRTGTKPSGVELGFNERLKADCRFDTEAFSHLHRGGAQGSKLDGSGWEVLEQAHFDRQAQCLVPRSTAPVRYLIQWFACDNGTG